MSQPRKRAFTLIELLVVISIIALLIGIILPALGSARIRAMILNCQTNVRSIGTAIEFYIAENNEIYPGGSFSGQLGRPKVPVNRFNWLGNKSSTGYTSAGASTEPQDRVLNRYVNLDYEGSTGSKSNTVAMCPLDKGDKLTQAGKYLAHEKFGTSYSNGDRNPSSGQKTGQFGYWFPEAHREAEVKVPTKKVLMMDLIWMGNRSADDSQHLWHNSSDPLQVSATFADGHGNTLNRKMGNDAKPTSAGNVGTVSRGVATLDKWAHNTDYY